MDLLAKFVTSVEGKYQDDQLKQLEALRVKLDALLRMDLKTKHKEEAEEIARKCCP